MMGNSLELRTDALSPTSQPGPVEHNLDLDPPDGGLKAWSQVGAAFCINTFTWGQTASYSIYLSYYLRAGLFPSATPTDYAFIGGLQFALSQAIAPLVTLCVRKLGTQIPMLFGVVFQTVGFISASYAQEIWHLYLAQGVAIGLGLGLIAIPATPILSQWFSKRRSLATGISSAGSGVGGLLFSFGIQAMIDNLSLVWAFRITAIICGVMNLFSIAIIRNRNKVIRPPYLGFDTSLLVRYDVLLLLTWGFVSMLGYIVLLYSLSDFSRSISLSTQQASAITAYLNLGTAIGRPAIGGVSDKLGRIEVAGCLTFFCGVTCFAIWIPASTYGVAILFAILSGAVVGVFWMAVAPISVEVVGLPEVPSLLSIMWVTITLPILFSEVIALKIRRMGASNEYLYPQVFAGLAFVTAATCLLELWRVIRKRAVILA